MRSTVALAAAISLASTTVLSQSAPSFVPTDVTGHFVEQFTEDWQERWSPSKATKEEKAGEVFSYVGKWSVEEPTVFPGISGDEGLVLKTKAAHHAISAQFDTPLDPTGQPLVVQYEVKLQKGLDCGGAYLKLLTDSEAGVQAEEFSDKTPYTIMFGPDRCGSTNKVHFIFRHTNPLTGEIEEKHLVSPPAPKIEKLTALYTLVVRPDQTYEIKINNESVKKGSLFEDFSPAVNPPKEIDDPEDKKPENWVDSPKISDPDAVKPDDWDEDAPQLIDDESAVKPDDWLEDQEATIPDPDAEKPEEWSDEDDGDWVAPMIANPACETASGCGPWTRPQIPNPNYKGKWFAPLIDNPDYKGPWAPRKIPNPNYFEDKTPANFNKIGAVGFELWSMTEDILFDNIYIGQSESDAAKLAAQTFEIKRPLEQAQDEAEQAKLDSAASSQDGSLKLGPVPDFKQDVVGWLQWQVQDFFDVALRDPVHAFKIKTKQGLGIAAAFATALAILTTVFSFILPTKKQVQQTSKTISKKTDAITSDIKDTTEQLKEQAQTSLPAEEKEVKEKVEEVKEGVKTRAGKAAQKVKDNVEVEQ